MNVEDSQGCAEAVLLLRRSGYKRTLPLRAFYFNCRTAAIIEKDGAAAQQAWREDAPNKLAQVYLYGVCGNQDGHFPDSQSQNKQNEQFNLPKQSVHHDAIIQSEERCALPFTSSLYFWIHKNIVGAFPRGLKQGEVTCGDLCVHSE